MPSYRENAIYPIPRILNIGLIFPQVHIYESSIAKLDIIAQMMILLGAVCHIIVGLSTEPCNSILSIVTMIIKMAMATRLPKHGNAKSDYDPNQHAILKQLPTSLFTALSYFNIEGRTTIYATCPSCNCTHESVYDAVAATAIYPL
ncbi:hypothetical protein Hypma_010459 [Hypsizygus marmoreus]|uniref:Uncharacterized protein n=1 Tax=Hypsizygus marmoreus TaxID=39966 RepID=A0A369K6G0_HYPMA|nr:hypothetical protein Hypma_010459 [Hypsizygus marmoreus]